MDMKKNYIVYTVFLISIVTFIITIYWSSTVLYKRYELTYDLGSMKESVNESNIKDKINDKEIFDIDFPYIDTNIESTATDCTTIGISMFQQYQGNIVQNNVTSMDIQNLQYERSRIITGDIKDFIIEITFNSRLLKDNASLLKEYQKDGKNRPLFRTRFHIKATDKGFSYKLINIGKNLE